MWGKKKKKCGGGLRAMRETQSICHWYKRQTIEAKGITSKRFERHAKHNRNQIAANYVALEGGRAVDGF